MQVPPLVSISIPIFKCEDFIFRCLQSVAAQTYRNIEVILVNDQTQDKSISIIEDFCRENPDFPARMIHHEKNAGLSVVRNTGIENAKGDYLYFLDSDDEITPDCISLLVEKALQSDATMVVAQNKWINTFDNTTKDFGFPTRVSWDVSKDKQEIFEAYCQSRYPNTSWNKLFKRDFIVRNKIYFVPGLYAQDELWFFDLMLKMDSVAVIPQMTYLYYLHASSVIFNRTKRNFENYLTILGYFQQAYKKETDRKRKQLLLQKIVAFKEMVISMQWKALKDKDYLQQNMKKMQRMPRFSFGDYFSSEISRDLKKKNFLQNLPSSLSAKLFVWRYER